MPRVREHHLVNLENRNVGMGKEIVKQPAVKPSRPALSELGNKIDESRNHITKPPSDFPQKLIEPHKSLRNENLVRKEKTVAVKSPIPKTTAKLENETQKHCELVAYSTKQLVDAEEQFDKADPLLVAEYVQDIYRYLPQLEVQYPIKPNFLTNHKTTPRMRSILMNWIIEAHKDFAYLSETLHLTVSLIDRYLQSDRTVDRNNLQLVGVSALWVAAKYEEMYVANLKDFVFLTDNAFTDSDVIRMERKILSGVNWCLGRPLSIHFLKRYSKVAKVLPKEYVLGKYLTEMALLQYELSHIMPSLLAAAAVCLSVAIMRDLISPSKVWTEQMVHQFSYEYTEIRDVVIQLAQFLLKEGASKYQAARIKYSVAKFSKISLNTKLNCTMVKTLARKAIKKT